MVCYASRCLFYVLIGKGWRQYGRLMLVATELRHVPVWHREGVRPLGDQLGTRKGGPLAYEDMASRLYNGALHCGQALPCCRMKSNVAWNAWLT